MFACIHKQNLPCVMMDMRSIAECDRTWTNHSMSVSGGLCCEYRRQIMLSGKEYIGSFDLSSEVCLRIRFSKKACSGSESAFLPVVLSDEAKQTGHPERSLCLVFEVIQNAAGDSSEKPALGDSALGTGVGLDNLQRPLTTSAIL